MTDNPLVVSRYPHERVGGNPDYHEWVCVARVKADKRGHPSPRMWDTNWALWRCNNVDCPAEAFVSDRLAISALEDAQGGPDD